MNTGDGKEMVDKDEKEKLIECENDTSNEDWGHSLEQKTANDIRRERRERERANWNSGGQARLSGFGQDHWEGAVGSWYQDQWWDSRTWRGKSETKGFGRMEKRWRGSREKLQSDGGSTSKGEGGYSGSENENRWGRPGRREGRGLEAKMMTWPDWYEEEAIAANKEISEEIQAGTSDEIRRTSDRCEDEAAASVEDSEEIQIEIETRRKREEVVARRNHGRRVSGRDQRRRRGKAGMGTRETDERTVDRNGKGEERNRDRRHLKEKARKAWIRPRQKDKIGIDRRLKDKWRWQSRERNVGLMKGG